MILLDTNLLTRMTRRQDPQSSLAREAVQKLLKRGEKLIIVPQNLYEFWASIRPSPCWAQRSWYDRFANRSLATLFPETVYLAARPGRAEQTMAGISRDPPCNRLPIS
ncbi:MAG: hypothetical protein WCJ06_12455 [Planctomycetota bacterium]